MDPIGDDINYYKANRLAFIDQYAGKYLIIKDLAVIGVYDTRSEAMNTTLNTYAMGTFIIERPMALKVKN